MDLVITNPDHKQSPTFTYQFTSPQITNIQPSKKGAGLELFVTGSQLSKDATFTIDGVKPMTATSTPNQLEDPNRGLYKSLTVTIQQPEKPDWSTKGQFTIINPDGRQSNTVPYNLGP